MTIRSKRVAEAIKRLTSEIVHNQLRDPRLKGFITITKVEITPDLRHAKIYYRVMDNEKKKGLVTQGLQSAKNFIRKYIGDELKLRYAPDISFQYDKKMEYSERINKILDKLYNEGTDTDGKKDNQGNKKI